MKVAAFFGVPAGSPPRMRETQEIEGNKFSAVGITPAYAGNTK